MSDKPPAKKPVWVDEEAHAILKEYAAMVNKPITDIANDLVLESLHLLDEAAPAASEPAPTPVSATPTPTPVEPPAAEVADEAPAPVAAEAEAPAAPPAPPAPPARRTPSARRDEETAAHHLGGVWLV
jgi:hypothetical protein